MDELSGSDGFVDECAMRGSNLAIVIVLERTQLVARDERWNVKPRRVPE
jgi:hypothetical protein